MHAMHSWRHLWGGWPAHYTFKIGDAGCAWNALMASPLSEVSLRARRSSTQVMLGCHCGSDGTRARWDTSLVTLMKISEHFQFLVNITCVQSVFIELYSIFTSVLKSVCLSCLANCRPQFLLDRLRRCLKLFVSTDNTSCHEFASQFVQTKFIRKKSQKLTRIPSCPHVGYLN